MANGEPFDLNKFLSETPVGERFVTEQEVNEGKYPQVRSGVWKEYANREPRFYASVAFNGAFWPLQVRGMVTIGIYRCGIIEEIRMVERMLLINGSRQVSG